MKSNWFIRNPFKSGNKVANEHKKSVEKAAVSVLNKYDKTFVDLAKYDRGEKIFDTVSQ